MIAEMTEVTLKPYLVLGQTIPEQSKKYGTRVCTAGYDPIAKEFVRVYPLQVHRGQHFRRWEYYPELPVKRNTKDNRPESWRLGCDSNELPHVQRVAPEKVRRKAKKYLRQIFSDHYAESIKQLNEERRSLALIRLHNVEPYFVNHGKKKVNARQLSLFDNTDYSKFTKDGFNFLPRIKFDDDAGLPHDLMLQSWDAYMHQKVLAPKYGVDNLWDRLRINDNREKFALIGNMNHQRNAWLIITIF